MPERCAAPFGSGSAARGGREPSGGAACPGIRSERTARPHRPTDRLLPSFDGELGLHLGEPGRSTLILDGRYQPPGGRIGTAVDTIALHRLARLTTTSLVSTTAAKLSTEARSSQTSPVRPPD